jgi:hypothetical protein
MGPLYTIPAVPSALYLFKAEITLPRHESKTPTNMPLITLSPPHFPSTDMPSRPDFFLQILMSAKTLQAIQLLSPFYLRKWFSTPSTYIISTDAKNQKFYEHETSVLSVECWFQTNFRTRNKYIPGSSRRG